MAQRKNGGAGDETSYPAEVDSRLFSAEGIREGNLVRLALSDGSEREGILMPRIAAGEQDMIILKLATGYNLTVAAGAVSSAKKACEGVEIGKVIPVSIPRPAGGLPKIGLVATGGTIGTHVDYFTGGVYMCRTPEEVLATVPEISRVADISEVSSPFTIASEDMNFGNYSVLAKEVGRLLNSPGVQGVIATHGTDTLHFTSAALSFALQGLTKPVCLVGAQRSPDRGSFDGSMNLLCAANFIAKRASAGVFLVMHATTSDDYCLAHWGAKVRKMHTSRRDAFRSVNRRPFARISYPDGEVSPASEDRGVQVDLSGKVSVRADFDPKVAMVKAVPNADPQIIDFYVSKGYKGLVLEGTGLGHVPSSGDLSWIPAVKRAVDAGLVVVSTSQTLWGATHPYVYRNLRLLGEAGAVFGKDMLPEVAYVKLAWLFGCGHGADRARELVQKNLAGEINEKLSADDFLV